MHAHLLQDIGLCIVAATGLAYLARFLRQPLLLAYILAGVIIGPVGLGWVEDYQTIQILAELGLAFLLFIVGLEIDLKKLLATGKQASIVTAVQVAGAGLLGWLAARLLGYQGLPAAYLGAAVAFSSTMIVVKLLSDRFELDTLPGRVTLGILLLQDVGAIIVLAVQPNLGGAVPLGALLLAPFKGLGLVAAAILLSRYALPLVFRSVAKFPEILLLSAVSWCFLVCYAALMLDFSIAMGALVAGVSISALPYSLDVVAKIRSLRDFFVTLFFVSLGMLLVVPGWWQIGAVLLLSAVAVGSRLVTVWPMLRLLGYDNRVSVLSSLHLAQTSEFGLVIVLIGISPTFAHITQDIVSLVLLTLIVTSTISTYLIQYSHRLAAWFMRETAGTAVEDRYASQGTNGSHEPAPIMLVGGFRVGLSLVHELRSLGKSCSVIDFNPQIHQHLTQSGVQSIYGDISSMETLEHAGVERAKMLVASIPDDFLRGTSNAHLLAGLRKINPTARIIVTAESIPTALALYQAGADFVLVPRILAAARLAEIIALTENGQLERRRDEEIARLKSRGDVIV